MQNNNKKEDIIIEIGSEWIRMGLVGQKVPRKSIRSKSLSKIIKDPKNQQNQMMMDQLLCNIFFVFVNSSCQNKTVIILQKVYTPRFILQMMANIMFKKLKIDKLELCLSCVTPLYLSARYSGVVISSGASCTEIMPVYQGYPLFRNYIYVDGGTTKINKIIRDQLLIMNPEVDKSIIASISEQQICEIKTNYSHVPPRNKEIIIPVKRNKLKFNESKISYDILFGDFENQEPNIAHSFLTVLDTVPIDCLDEICDNIVFSGGLWRVNGIQNYFKKHVSQLIKKFKKLQNLQVRKKLSFVTWGFNPSEVAFIGCSIGASVKNIEHLTIKRESGKDKNEDKFNFSQKIMQTYFLSG